MTNLNELRELLIMEYPNRCIHVSACCKYSPDNQSLPRRRTELMATLWAVGQLTGIVCQVSAHTAEGLFSAVRTKLSDGLDEQVELSLEAITAEAPNDE